MGMKEKSLRHYITDGVKATNNRHINDQGEFKCAYPDLGPDKVVLSLKDPRAHWALTTLAYDYMSSDTEFARALLMRLRDLSSRDPEELRGK